MKIIESVVVVSLVLLSQIGFAQFGEAIEELNRKANSYELNMKKRIKLNLKRKGCLAESYNIFHFYYTHLPEGVSRSSFDNGEILKHLAYDEGKVRCFLRKKSYPRSLILVYDNQNTLKAYGEDLNLICISDVGHNIPEKMLNFVKEYDIRIGFHISGTNGMILFGASTDNLYVLNLMENKVHAIEDFVSCCWSTLYLNNN